MPMPFQDRIAFEDVSFTYRGRDRPAVHDISVAIPRGSRVAVVGRTGSGKSTFADLLMGLLDPTEGRVTVDGVPISPASRRGWQRRIAHVPQAIFLADAGIARNIAFGAPGDDLDQDRIAAAARAAQLHDFIDGLPDKYDTRIGERGVRLSGGQRQRLGLARAIYKDAPVLVLDEATSALDEETEQAVLDALDLLQAAGRTIIVIAHRQSTIAGCNMVLRLEHGRLAEVRALPAQGCSHSETAQSRSETG